MTTAAVHTPSSGLSSSASSLVPEIHLPPSQSTESAIKKAREIPTSFRESFGAWWGANPEEAELSETRLLKRLPFFLLPSQPSPPPTASNPDPLTARAQSIHLPASTPKTPRFINTVSFTTPSTAESEEAVVLLHGYGAGLGFYYLNWEGVARASAAAGKRSYALDWLGMGRSARPSPKELDAGKNATTPARVLKAETFFLDSLDQWRSEMKINKMTLIGHSLGGYLATAYALRWPERVERLILLSPAGIPENPNAPSENASLASSPSSSPPPSPGAINAALREVNEPQTETVGGGTGTELTEKGAPPKVWGSLSTTAKAAAAKKEEEAATAAGGEGRKKELPKTRMTQLWGYLWEKNYSPFALVRSVGPWAPLFVGKYTSRRFSALPEEDQRDMNGYIWTILTGRGSSEYCITHLLAPGAHARMPMVNRIDKLKMPISFVYGDRDWMDPKGGAESIRRLRKAGNVDGKLWVVEGAGHHVYLDNPEATNKIIRDAIAGKK